MRFAKHITLYFDRFRWKANANQRVLRPCTVVLPEVLVPDDAQAERQKV
jgi:hypothetical protein